MAPNVKLKGKRGCVCSVDEEGSPNTAAMDTLPEAATAGMYGALTRELVSRH